VSTQIGDNDTVFEPGAFVGPFKSRAGAFYAFLTQENVSSQAKLRAFKASDPTSSWSAVDTAGEPVQTTASTLAIAVSCCQNGDTIEAVYFYNAAGTVTLRHVSFDMGADTWGTPATVDSNSLVIPGYGSQLQIMARSDGDLLVLYCGDQDSEMGSAYYRVDCARDEGSGWGNILSVDNSPAGGAEDDVSYFCGQIVKGSADRAHFFLVKDGGSGTGEAYQRTFTSANSLQSWPSAYDSATGMMEPHAHGINYYDGTNQLVRCPYLDADDKISYAEFVSSNTPTPTTNTGITDNTVLVTSLNVVAAAVIAGEDEYLVYSNSADSDLYYDKNKGTDTEFLDAVTAQHVSANGYDDGGERIGVIWGAFGGPTYYDEIDISVSITNLTGVKFPDQNYYTPPIKT
jgi:hypothetical protein